MQVSASFSGVGRVIRVSYTLAHGISPGVALLDMVPQGGFQPAAGALVLECGGTRLEFPDCLPVRLGSIDTQGGTAWRLVLLDRRWRWWYGRAAGRYNLRYEDNRLIEAVHSGPPEDAAWNTLASPRTLAALLLDELGEQAYDVSALPDEPRPRQEWDGLAPAAALAELCDALGTRIVLSTTGQVVLHRLGQGAALPDVPELIARHALGGPLAGPCHLAIVCERTRWQADLELEAVGVEMDGTLRPIDALSYRPAGGWGTADLPHFLELSDPRARELARASVFRCYRVKLPVELRDAADQPLLIGSLSQLALQPVQLEVVADGVLDRPRPAQVFGVWFPGGDAAAYENPPGNTAAQLAPLVVPPDEYSLRAVYSRGFELDARLALVRFAEPVYKLVPAASGSGAQPAAAELRLRTTVCARAGNRSWLRHERLRMHPAAPPQAPVRYVERPELALTIRLQYNPATYQLSGSQSNLTALEQEADHYLDALALAWQAGPLETASYAGLLPIEPDGAIVQVNWTVGPDGAITHVARHQEPLDADATHAERRLWERLRHIVPLQAADAQQPARDLAMAW
jgi:hypothetical protein